MKIVTCIFLSLLFCAGCKNKTIVYNAPEFKNHYKVEGKILNDTVIFDYAEQLDVVDSLLIMADYRFDKCIFIFNKNTGELLCTRGRKGKGPGELIKPVQMSIDKQTKDLYIHDYGKQKLFRYSIPELLAGSDLPQEEIELNRALAKQAHISFYKDSLFISHGYNRLLIASLGNYKIEDNEPFPEILSSADDWNIFLQNWSCRTFDPSRNRYARATLIGGIMEIFTISDRGVQLKHRHFFYEPLFEKRGTLFLPIPETVYGFRHVVATAKYIYASMIGQTNPKSLPKTIYRFDWKGKPVDCIETPFEIENFIVSEDDSRIYATVYVGHEQFPAVISLKRID